MFDCEGKAVLGFVQKPQKGVKAFLGMAGLRVDRDFAGAREPVIRPDFDMVGGATLHR